MFAFCKSTYLGKSRGIYLISSKLCMPYPSVNPEKTLIQCQINAADRQTDQLVYELYGPTEEESKIVDEGTK